MLNNTPCTLFNFSKNGGVEQWNPVLLPVCLWTPKVETLPTTGGFKKNNLASVFIDWKQRPEEMLYSIVQEPVAPVVTQYLRGEADKQLAFHLLCWKDRYTEELREQNYQNYEALSQWFTALNILHKLPSMNDQQMPQKIEVVGNPYEHEKQDDAKAACYGMQCVFYYFEKGVVQ